MMDAKTATPWKAFLCIPRVSCSALYRVSAIRRGEAKSSFRGTKGTFDTDGLVATGEGGGSDAIKEPIRIETPEGTPAWSDGRPHMKNWLECIRGGKKPNADVHAGYSHSVAAIMAHESIDRGYRLRFDPVQRAIL